MLESVPDTMATTSVYESTKTLLQLCENKFLRYQLMLQIGDYTVLHFNGGLQTPLYTERNTHM